MKKISDIPKLDRPREKLQQKGPESLSDLELMAILLGRGVEGHDVFSVADHVLKVMEAANGRPTLDALQLQLSGKGAFVRFCFLSTR
jgi:DNA repair protein RadC